MPNRAPTRSPQALEQASLKATYSDRLKRFLAAARAPSSKSAIAFGQAALKAKLTSIEVVILHEQSMMALASDEGISFGLATSRRAGRFLLRVLQCFERQHQKACTQIQRLALRTTFLRQQAHALVIHNRKLQQEVKRRQASESAAAAARAEAQEHLKESAELQQRLRHLTHSALKAQEDDRRQISRDLHDAIMQTLAGITVELTALGAAEKVGQRAFRQKLARTQRLIQQSVGTVHRFARDLRPAILDDLGLIPALRSLVTALPQRRKLKVRLTSHPQVENLDCDQRTAFFRVIQEALNNVLRHAKATEVHILFTASGSQLRAEVIDNGRSFDPSQVNQSKRGRRLGLIGMRERMEMIGGSLTIVTEASKKTVVCAEIPLSAIPGAA